MKFANIGGRLHLLSGNGALDVNEASAGSLPSDPAEAFARWKEITDWAKRATGTTLADVSPEQFGAPSPDPKQIFAVGLNYAPHAAESGFKVPDYPFVFTKTAASLAAPFGDLEVRSETVDWEVELVVVIGKTARDVEPESGWDHVAGITLGQDFSDREIQGRLGPNTQPTLGKSLPGFGPIGPVLVTPDEFEDRDDIELACWVNGKEMQRGRTSELIFDVPTLVSYLSRVVPLYPGDIIFTGTPAGVGFGRKPPLYLKPGDIVETYAEGVGTMRHRVVAHEHSLV